MSGSAGHSPGNGALDDKDRLIHELREALRAREELLDIAAHELRNPMTALLIQVEDALRVVSPQETRLIHRLRRIEQLIGRTVLRASTLLDASRLNAGTYRAAAERLDLAQIVREAAEGYAAQAEHAGVTVRTVAPDTLELTSDRVALEQIVDNLLSNAIKFGAGAPVDISLIEAGDAIQLTVRDRGVGIAAEDQARIFERFERVIAMRPRGGFGLGLWITRQLVEALGGIISIASTPGDGATFTVSFSSGSNATHELPRP